ncbi:MAG TPA: DNA mismatch endonuclease Vsr [Bacteroidales bacterium]|nr:DNA mismatch endonuclease Vsr [Bacteroidales bacterium]
MTDIFSKEKRSQIMVRVRAIETKPEILIRKYLFSQGFRFRKNVKSLPGCPDIVLPKYRTVIFIHGCFWHGHKNCISSALPKSNKEYWVSKISSNIIRDKKNKQKLKKLGWNVIIIWECCILNKQYQQKTFTAIHQKIKLK